MKVLNYIAILAVLSVSGMLGAQTAVTPAQTAPASATSEANGVRVQTTVNNREINVRVDAQNSSVLASSQDMLNRILAETTKATGTDTIHGKIFNSLISAVKSTLSDPHLPARTPVTVTASIRPDTENSYVSNMSVEMNGERYACDARSTVNADESITTTGNVTATNENGETRTNAVVLAVRPNGDITGSVGNSSIAERTLAAQTSEFLVLPQSRANQRDSHTSTTSSVVPDNSMLISGQR